MERLDRLLKRWNIIFISLTTLLIFLITFGFLLFKIVLPSMTSDNLGVRIVRAMYQFNTLYDLSESYKGLKAVCEDDVWEQITPDNDSRVISAYYKFQSSSSKVNFVYVSDGVVVYTLLNEYIDPNRLFILYYEYSGDKITSIREYELKGVSYGDSGVW